MIERQNILSLLKASKSTVCHSAVLTCYAFDPIFFTSYFMPVLRTRRIDNVVVFMDAGRYDELMATAGDFGNYLQGYTLVRQQASVGAGVFHPKIFMLIGNKGGEAFVGSGNLTYSGLSLNDEVWTSFFFDGHSADSLPVIADVWRYLSQLSASSLVSFQMESIEGHADWLRSAKEERGGAVEKDGVRYSFVCNEQGKSIFAQLRNAMGRETVEKVTAIAPFYDEEASVVRSFKAARNTLFVDTSNGSVPRRLPDDYSVYDWAAKEDCARKLHAKIFQIETASATFLLVGSANATRSAFGLNPLAMNDEACILITDFNKRNFVAELGFVPMQNCLPHEDLDQCEPTATDAAEEPRGVKIAWAEFKEQVLSLGVESSGEEWILCVESTAGQVQEFPFLVETTLGDSDVNPFIVYIKQDGQVVSNRCLVISEGDVLKTQPNSSLGKFAQYLRNPDEWAKNIAGILENVQFDNGDDAAVSAQPRAVARHSGSVGKEIFAVRENFDESPTSIKGKLAVNKNLMVLDFFRGIFENVRPKHEGRTVGSEEMETDEGFDEVFLMQDETEQRMTARRSAQVNSFLKKAIAQFHRALDEKPASCLSDRPLSKATLNPSSIPAIANDLIILDSPSEANIVWQRRKQFLELATLACIVFRDGIQADDPYRKNKIAANIKYFINKSLLLFAHFAWPKEQEMLVSALNVLYLMRHVADNIDEQLRLAENSLTNLFAEAQRNDLSINDASVRLVQKAFSAYARFFRNKKEDNLKHITTLHNGDIIKVQSLCFAAISDVKQNTLGFYQYTYRLPLSPTLPPCATKGLISCVEIE